MVPTFWQRFKNFALNVPDIPPEKPRLWKLATIVTICAIPMFTCGLGLFLIMHLNLQASLAYAAEHPGFTPEYPSTEIPLILTLSGIMLQYYVSFILLKLVKKPEIFLQSRLGHSMGNQILLLLVWTVVVVPLTAEYFLTTFDLPHDGSRTLIVQARLENFFFAWGWIFVLSFVLCIGCLAIFNNYRNYYRKEKMLPAEETK